MTVPLTISAAWRGNELFTRDDWLRRLTESECQSLRIAIASANQAGKPVEELTGEDLPLGPFDDTLKQIQHDLEFGAGACLVKGIDLESLTEVEARTLFWTIAVHLGTPVSQTASGDRIFSVRDEGFQIGDPRARGPNTRKRLNFHTDRCDVIAFLCLKQAKSGGENQLVSSVTLYNEMLKRRPDLLEILMQPFFYQRHNVDTGNENPWCQQPIFSFCDGHFAASYLRVLIDRAYNSPDLPDMTSQQVEALDYLDQLAADPTLCVTFRQEPGDLLFLNNWVTFHRRTEFEDHSELALRRHLLRIWLSVPNNRPLVPAFADNYGATQAGAIRGGMRPR